MAVFRVALADLADPPDTSQLAACDDTASAAAVEVLRRRLLRRHKNTIGSGIARSTWPCPSSAVLGALRRLQSPQLSGYHFHGGILLSEPFGGVPSSISSAPPASVRALLRRMFGRPAPAALVRVLAAFGVAALKRAATAGTTIAIIPKGGRFRDFSASVDRSLPEVDTWFAPPSGLFVVDERRVLLREGALRMTAAHEFGHALDAALAQRSHSYFSFESEELRFYFATATGFVNEYASTGLDEYFAESVRAYVEINDARCAWLPLTRQDLYLRDPRMFALVERLFASDLCATERRRPRR